MEHLKYLFIGFLVITAMGNFSILFAMYPIISFFVLLGGFLLVVSYIIGYTFLNKDRSYGDGGESGE